MTEHHTLPLKTIINHITTKLNNMLLLSLLIVLQCVMLWSFHAERHLRSETFILKYNI